MSEAEQRPCWFVGEPFKKLGEQLDRFLGAGIWENKQTREDIVSRVKEMRAGDRIVIKTMYHRGKRLPFDNGGKNARVLAIWATGVVKSNPGTGQLVFVKWENILAVPRKWYRHVDLDSVWKVMPGTLWADELIAFAFDGKPQNFEIFDPHFAWTEFCMLLADRLLAFRNRRDELVQGMLDLSRGKAWMNVLEDRLADDTRMPLEDIDPFTVFALFNRGITAKNKRTLARDLAKLTGGIDRSMLRGVESFKPVPEVKNRSTWFFSNTEKRSSEDIDLLWELFARALAFADTGMETERDAFALAYDRARGIRGAGWNLTIGLHWIRPWFFVPLDRDSRERIVEHYEHLSKLVEKECDAATYLALREGLLDEFGKEGALYGSFPGLSCGVSRGSSPDEMPMNKELDERRISETAGVDAFQKRESRPEIRYGIEDILKEGSFVPEERLELMLGRLREKKNLILQGPPGTGKTWLARRLAWAHMGAWAPHRLCAVQFHAAMSYEDFVRGWRPDGQGRLALCDGPLLRLAEQARETPGQDHVMLIEEINRGNPARIFGEMLSLLEADKRTQANALALGYPRSEDEQFFLPPNLYLIGTMNIADRSLAMVDFAFRRRFAFVDLEPEFGEAWQNWLNRHNGIPMRFLRKLGQRMTELNNELATDSRLGPQYKIGHSYFTPPANERVLDEETWYNDVIQSEVGPLLEEYWYDDPRRAQDVREKLLLPL